MGGHACLLGSPMQLLAEVGDSCKWVRGTHCAVFDESSSAQTGAPEHRAAQAGDEDISLRPRPGSKAQRS